MRISPTSRRRSGATSVEFAFVAILLFMLLFGIFEYGRFLFVYHMTTNAARDAARFAVVRTGGGTLVGEPATVTKADIIEVWRTGMFNGKSYGAGMCGMESQITNYTVEVFAVPESDLYAATPNLDAAGKPDWTSATFHQQIAVRISGTYKTVVSGLIGLSSEMPFTVIVLMGSEAN